LVKTGLADHLSRAAGKPFRAMGSR